MRSFARPRRPGVCGVWGASFDEGLGDGRVRFTLFDLLIGIALVGIPAVMVWWLMGPWGRDHSALAYLGGLLTGLIVYPLLSSPLYRWLRRPPMNLPRCPTCRGANRHYVVRKLEWPREQIECATCHQLIELHLDGADDPSVTTENPRFLAIWPHSWGRWRRL